jgi:hypothetical protein
MLAQKKLTKIPTICAEFGALKSNSMKYKEVSISP